MMKFLFLSTGILLVAALLLKQDGWQHRDADAANYASVSAGGQHSCALTSGGGVQCWGRGAEGQLGDGSLAYKTRPVAVSGLSSGVSQVSVGERHTCAVLTGGTVKCWGRNVWGNLGDGTTTARTTPVNVCASGSGGGCTALTGVASVSANNDHTCAVTTAGGVKCWGLNNAGQLGNGTGTSSALPVDVTGLPSGVASVSTGLYHTCALLAGGGVKCWGNNASGQLGDGTTDPRLTPVQVSGLTSGVASIDVGGQHSCAVTTAQALKCWGDNGLGAVGDNTTTSRNTPVTVCAPGAPTDPCGSLTGVLLMSAGGGHTCVYKAAATYCWGWDGWGQLGDGSGSLADFTKRPAQVSGLGTLLSISAGTGHTCVVFDPTAAANCWGWNSDGQLGDGTTTDRATWQSGQDFDRDGCADYRELQSTSGSEASGGKRNPKSFWDFFDTPNASNVRDRVITSGGTGDASDVSRIQARYGSSGDPNIDALSAPPPTGYHPAFDRSDDTSSSEPWDLGPPNGTINIYDIIAMNTQFTSGVGHTCT